MSFSDAMDNAMNVWFGADFADSVTLNGDTVPANVNPSEVDEKSHGLQDVLNIEFRVSDYPVVDHRSDTLAYAGAAWSNPIQVRADAYTRVVAFRRNATPKVGR
jgi:hypothetical protein